MTTSYARFTVSIYNSERTPKELQVALCRLLLYALPDEELEVEIDEHTEDCIDEFCGDHE